jgi:Flp pilus assembly protein TadB
MKLAEILASKHPELKRKLLTAKINKKPEEYMAEVIKKTVMLSVMVIIVIFLFFNKDPNFIVIFIGSIIISVWFFYIVNFKNVDAKILKRGKDIDKEVLFAGRFLLIKLNGGQTLIGAIFDASKSFGVANKYFKEIVRDIELGTPLEEALGNAAKFSASKRFEKILFHVTNALKIGINVTKTLDSVLDEIAEEQLIEIQRYGKKLNSLTMFYMLMAIILPSLGMTMAVIILSMMPDMGDLSGALFWFFGILLVVIQVIFITTFKGARPNVNI